MKSFFGISSLVLKYPHLSTFIRKNIQNGAPQAIGCYGHLPSPLHAPVCPCGWLWVTMNHVSTFICRVIPKSLNMSTFNTEE